MFIYKWSRKKRPYVGKWVGSVDSLKRRYRKEINSGANRYIINAMRKYGIENFKFKILEKCKSKEKLVEMEKYWIKKLKSKSPSGYNMTDGGDGLLNPSKETRRKMSLAKIGRSPSNKGVPCSKEKKQKLRQASLGKKPSKSARRKTSKKISLLWQDPKFRAKNIKAKLESWKRRKENVKSNVRR